MIDLIRGEIYRLLHKKSMYIYFCTLALCYFALAFIRSGGFGEESAASDARTLFSLLPALAGGFMFAAIYTDDLNSKNLISLVGYGLDKLVIVIVKFVLMILSCALIFGFVPLYHCAIYALLGISISPDTAATVFVVSMKYLLMTLAYAALSGIAVYGLQRATFAIVTFLLLAFGVVGSLITAALITFAPDLIKHLVSGVTDRILTGILSGGSAVIPVAGYCAWLLVGLALSAIVFYRKEMEF